MASPPSGKLRKVASTGGRSTPQVENSSGRSTIRPRHGRPEGVQFKIPIAVKFATVIAIVMVGFMGWQTSMVIREVGESHDRNVNQRGIELVTALSSLLGPISGHDYQREIQADLETFFEAGREHGILNIVAYDKLGNALATARGEQRFTRTSGTPVGDDSQTSAASVEIKEFEYGTRRVRSFSRRDIEVPVRPRPRDSAEDNAELRGEVQPTEKLVLGRIELYLSAAEIAQSRAQLTGRLLTVSITACILATLVSFGLARFLTRPIRMLLKDMRQVSQGHLDHQSQVNSPNELGDLARSFNVMTRNLQTAQHAKVAQRALEHELSLATQIQTRLLPTEIPKLHGWDIAAYYLSAKEVGGDYYDLLPIGEDRIAAVIADVSGKGVPAALVMTMTRSLLHAASEKEDSPAAALEQVHRFLTPDMNPGMFVTLAYLSLDTRTGEVKLVRCGHNAPLLYNHRSRRVVPLKPRGIALGLDRNGKLFSSELQTQRFTMHTGDVLVCYTDGIVEGKNPAGDDYSEERLARVIAANARANSEALIAAVVTDLKKHQRDAPQSDDITMFAIRKTR